MILKLQKNTKKPFGNSKKCFTFAVLLFAVKMPTNNNCVIVN